MGAYRIRKCKLSVKPENNSNVCKRCQGWEAYFHSNITELNSVKCDAFMPALKEHLCVVTALTIGNTSVEDKVFLFSDILAKMQNPHLNKIFC